MKIISNNKNQKLSVGIDIGSSKICCAIGQVNNANTKVKLLGLAKTKSSGIKKGIIDKILPPNYFFPVSPNNIQELFNPGIKQDVKSKLSDTYVCHTWNEMFRKYDINKRVFPPKGSFMYSQFETHGILQSNEKIYTKALMLRFNPVISIFYKIFSRIKVTIKNYKK